MNAGATEVAATAAASLQMHATTEVVKQVLIHNKT